MASCGGQGERRVEWGPERVGRLEGHPARPALHAEVEVEDGAWVASRDQDREARDDRQQGDGQPQHCQYDDVRELLLKGEI